MWVRRGTWGTGGHEWDMGRRGDVSREGHGGEDGTGGVWGRKVMEAKKGDGGKGDVEHEG